MPERDTGSIVATLTGPAPMTAQSQHGQVTLPPKLDGEATLIQKVLRQRARGRQHDNNDC